jgi:hypothetical protein
VYFCRGHLGTDFMGKSPKHNNRFGELTTFKLQYGWVGRLVDVNLA